MCKTLIINELAIPVEVRLYHFRPGCLLFLSRAQSLESSVICDRDHVVWVGVLRRVEQRCGVARRTKAFAPRRPERSREGESLPHERPPTRWGTVHQSAMEPNSKKAADTVNKHREDGEEAIKRSSHVVPIDANKGRGSVQVTPDFRISVRRE